MAETVSIDGGVLVLVLAVLLLVLLAVGALVVAGIVAGYRSGREPARRRATAVWVACLVLEGAALAVTVAGLDLNAILVPAVALVTTLGARWFGRHRRTAGD
jgi:hypothetical protein